MEEELEEDPTQLQLFFVVKGITTRMNNANIVMVLASQIEDS